MKFNYKARTKEGELQVGNVEAVDRQAALNILLSHGLFILSIEPIVAEKWYDRISSFFKKVKAADLMIFTRQLSTLIASQVPLSNSLDNLYKQTQNPVLKETIGEIGRDIDSGFSLSQALEREKGVFSDFYVNMVRSAEVTGRLNEVLEFLAEYLEKQAAMNARVKNALMYPAFVIVLFIVVMFLVVSVVLPQIQPIFTEAGVELPIYTRAVLFVGSFTSNWWWAILIILGVVAVMLVDYFQTNEGRVVRDELVLRIPFVGGLFQKLYISRFAESARILIKGGLTIPQAVEISAHTVGNAVYQQVLHEAAEEIGRGRQLSAALEGRPEFPPLVFQLISVGESTGHLEILLEKISDFYTRQVEDVVANLVSLIQPFLMVVIGVLIALLFASILLPLYSLSRIF